MKRTIRILFYGILSCLLCGCGNAQADNRDGLFEYREIYLPGNGTPEAAALGLDNIDKAWGLWGHNLASVLPSKPSQTVYARQNGSTVHDQFCFMSNHLFGYIENYIVDNYGEEDSLRFAILPNDNGIVCLCAKCTEEGNTRKDASPAVFHMIRRLAERFPKHTFFTSYYKTARGIPADPLPANAGVLISAMNYPISTAATPQEQSFERLLSAWSTRTEHVYIWDYVNNFDDYFTPFPVFSAMQRRLQLYASTGVKGVFFNGSGTDYSTFSRLKLHGLAALLDNPDADWRELLPDLCRKFYPVAGDAIARFMLLQEDYAVSRGRTLPMYEGVKNALDTYLPEAEFIAFHDELLDLLPQIRGDERKSVQKLAGALSLTRLELMRLHGETEGWEPLLEQLSRFGTEVAVYSESCWSVADYVRDYTFMQEHAALVKEEGTNLLRGVRLSPLTELDPDYSDISVLTDGLTGLPSNYHCGNLLSSADPSLRISIPAVEGLRRLRVCLTRNPEFRMALPRQVMLTVGEERVGAAEPKRSSAHQGHAFVEFDLPPSPAGPIVLSLIRDPEVHTMSVCEIEGFVAK